MSSEVVLWRPQPNNIYQMDALQLLQHTPDNSIDLFFADPPYNLSFGYDGYKDNLSELEYLKWCYAWLNEADRVLKPTGTLMLLHIPRYAIPLAAHLHTKLIFRHWIAWSAAGRKSHMLVEVNDEY